MTNKGIPPFSIITYVYSLVPLAILVKAHALSSFLFLKFYRKFLKFIIFLLFYIFNIYNVLKDGVAYPFIKIQAILAQYLHQ